MLRMSAVKPKLAALCMFGGHDSPSPEALYSTFVRHRENGTSFLMQSGVCFDAGDPRYYSDCEGDGEWLGSGHAENEGMTLHDDTSVPQRPASTHEASAHSLDDVGQVHSQDTSRYGNGKAPGRGAARALPLQLASTRPGPASCMHVSLAHRCGYKACVCETECLAVHEVEPPLPPRSGALVPGRRSCVREPDRRRAPLRVMLLAP